MNICFGLKLRRAAVLLAAALVMCGCGLVGSASQAWADDELYDVTIEGTYHQSDAYSMLAMVNKFRTAEIDYNDGNTPWAYDEDGNKKASNVWSYYDESGHRQYVTGLKELKWDSELEEIAMQRAAEIAVRFEHERPNGKSYNTVISSSGKTATGENIVASNDIEANPAFNVKEELFDAKAAFESWREDSCDYNGQGHRRNMLGTTYTAVGIACFEHNGVRYWAMELGSATNEISGLDDAKKAVSVSIAKSYIDYYKFVIQDEDLSKSIKNNKSISLPVTCTVRIKGLCFNPSLQVSLGNWFIKSGSDVVKLDGNTVTGLKAGTAVLTNTALGKEVAYTITVKDKDTPTISGFDSEKSVKLSDGKFTLSAKSSSGTAAKYTSSDTSVATVDSTSGVVTPLKSGTTKITVEFAGTDDYEAVSKTMTLSVSNDSGWVINPDNNSWTTPDGSTVTIIPAATTTKVSNPSATAIKSLKKAKKAFTVKWNKKSGVTGYQIRYSLKSNMKSAKTVKVASAKTTSKKISKLKKKKKYYVQVRTYKVVNGKTYYSGWSGKKSVKTK